MNLPAVISRAVRRPAFAGEQASALVENVGSWIAKAGHLTFSGFIPDDWGWNWFQRGYNPIPTGDSAIVYACVASYAQTLAMCPGTHWRRTEKGGRKRVEASALTRVLKQPNTYQSISDLLLNLGRNLYHDGNAYVLIERNARFEPARLHLFQSTVSSAKVASTGDIFYTLAGNEMIERQLGQALLSYVPARDVIHFRLTTPKHPLVGEPPLTSAMMEIAASNAVIAQTLAFVNRQARPSITLQTDQALSREQVQLLRDRWNEQSVGWNSGGTPILTNGLKVAPVSMSSRDAQLAEILQFSNERIAAAYRVPLAILSLMTGQGPQGSTESLMQFWVSSGLGFCLNHIEEAIGLAFGLRGWPDEYVEFDTSALLRSNFRDRIEALARGVQGGVYAPNEARAQEELPAVEFGDEPRLQQQDVPLSAWYASQPDPTLAPPAAPAPPAETPAPVEDNADAIGSAEFAELVYASIERHERPLAA